ncbi:Bacterial extracellular solute-binding protein [Paenibacillus konkukensis]|uniref:Bacterial extracellular solute-binding protein n=1 Tax=Paenibacillus konkukensis TaxID=2020716 RepID=A0ABY4RXV5_9BACL|nr:extracellular solute-binding protein [Paenibacillus konkukensis]UQZ86501.1 Bacterial extracellular solute-binding protein [Paenibacillus konkukensis]
MQVKWKRIRKRFLAVLMIGSLGLSCTSFPALPQAAAADTAGPDAAKPAATLAGTAGTAAKAAPTNQRQVVKANEFEPYYANVLKGWQDKGIKAGTASIEIKAADVSEKSDEAAATVGSYEGKSNVLLWNSPKESWVEYQVNVPADGLYEMQVSYRPYTGKSLRRPVNWDIKLDGAHPFREASSVALYRQWKDARPIKKDRDGNDIRPKSEDISNWSLQPLRDSGGAYSEPLQWYFSKGTHTIRLQSFDPVALESIKLAPQTKPKPYQDVAAAYPQSKPVEAETATLQAEDVEWKNDSAIQITSDTDPRTVPLAKGRITFNSIGGKKWYNQNQEITWTIDAPESGKYKLAFRELQNTISQKASFRRIAIDGKVPFQEMLAYRFPYATGWQGMVVADDQGKPYEFYLEKGKHTLTLAVTHDPFKPVIIGIEEITDILQGIDQDLKSLTGGQDDKNRTWKIAQDMPDLPKRLTEVSDLMKKLSEQVQTVNGRKDNVSESLNTSIKDIEELLSKVDDIPYHKDTISSMNEKVSNFIETLVQQPLQFDEIYVAPVEKNFPVMEASLFSKMKGMVVNFFYSFQSKDRLSDLDDKVLNVWVQRGRDYVTQLQELADETFTPDTGIQVKVNLLPNAQLLVLANAAGIQPDIALGLTQDLPVDYAIRNSIYDISKFPDFKDLYKNYSPGSWLPFYYNKGYYAVPETQAFHVLYYRKDILSRLGLSIPETWDDVYDMLPTLQQNYMNFYMPPTEYMTFIYQNHADFFDKDGVKTALDTPEGFKAFKQWTDLFNIYAMDRSVSSFYQHFRKGDMPIGFADYNTYIQLSAAAPELNGSWGIAQIPGTRQPDGTLARWSGGGQTAGVIFNSSKKKDQAWEFMKWWASADTQERYGSDLEAFNGVSFRWNTANVEAFSKLPWKREDANVILEQWRWYKDMPNLPGGYFVGREINNAWNRAVVDGMNYRSSLEQTVLDINRELRRKQQEFGFIDANGEVIKTMDLPVVDKPWDGVNPYVK